MSNTKDTTHPGLGAKNREAVALVAQMSVDEKAAMCSGNDFWHLKDNDRLKIHRVMVTDGPHGLRKYDEKSDQVGLNACVPATCFPTASGLASSWNLDLIHRVGIALGELCVAENVTVLLGPGMNIKRHPGCGRNFEYFSEDPLLSGKCAAAMINGVQSQGVGTSIKHYAVNNQEYHRMYIDVIVDERSLREIYLRGFEIAVKDAKPWTVMCAYNRINGSFCSENKWLLSDVLRDEWGYEGLVVSDWGATNDRVKGIAAGLDLEMPGSGGMNDKRIESALLAGDLTEFEVDRAIVRNVSLSLLGADLAERNHELNDTAHHELAKEAAIESIVLLTNDGTLPLSLDNRFAIIGEFAKKPRYQGAGSSQVRPTRLECAWDALRERVGNEAYLDYAQGYDALYSNVNDTLIDEAVDAASRTNVAIVFAGLPSTYESESFDRPNIDLPAQQNRLIEAVCAANLNTIVVLSNGAPVAMPWAGKPSALIEGYLGGQASGSAIVDILFGDANPSGKLAETFPIRLSDVASDTWFPGSPLQVQYREGLFVGYRYFDSAKVEVEFPFGHGLSYTTFEYSNLRLSRDGNDVIASVDVTNCGERTGCEVVQVYVHDVHSSVIRPDQELKAFAKAEIKPLDTRTISLQLDTSAFSYYDVDVGDWVIEGGTFEIRVGSSSRDIRLRHQIEIESTFARSDQAREIPDPDFTSGRLEVNDETFAAMIGRPIPSPDSTTPFHINSPLNALAETWLGRRLQNQVRKQFAKQLSDVEDDPTAKKLFDEMANSMPLRALALFSEGRFTFKMASLALAIMNGRYFQAIRLLCRKGDHWKNVISARSEV